MNVNRLKTALTLGSLRENYMKNQIELTRLWARQDAKTGKLILSGKFGFSARLRIEELIEPDERGATHIVFVLPPYVARDGDERAASAATAPVAPARSATMPRSAAPPAPAFGFAEE